ncbi:phosphopantetheine-binding protein [Ralstonia syzygii subsp. celebesensis]
MAPNLVHFIDRIPVTVHGKADRKALLAGDVEATAQSREQAVHPQALAAWLQQYFIGVLGVDELAVDDDLFDQGATSFTLVQAVHSIQQQYRVALPVDVFLEQPTIAAVAAHILGAKGITPGEAEAAPRSAAPVRQQAELDPVPVPLEGVRFDSRAYRRPDGGSSANRERLEACCRCCGRCRWMARASISTPRPAASTRSSVTSMWPKGGSMAWPVASTITSHG